MNTKLQEQVSQACSCKKYMNKTISYAVYNRPDYLESSLKSLIKNDLQGWEIFFSIDPSEEINNIIDVIEKTMKNFNNYSININKERLGVESNTYASLDFVFSNKSDINIYLEDDIIVSPDITQIADWYLNIEKEDIICLNLLYGSCGGRNHKSNMYENIFYKTQAFNSLGYILTKQQWESYFKNYWFDYSHKEVNREGKLITGWDWAVFFHNIKNQNLYTLQPDYARANHIGRVKGTFCTPIFHDKIFSPIRILTKKQFPDNYKII